MTKLKLAGIDDDKPVKLTVTLSVALHRNLVAYAEVLAKETGKSVETEKLIAPMLEKFIASDRGFRKARRADHNPNPVPSQPSAESAAAAASARD